MNVRSTDADAKKIRTAKIPAGDLRPDLNGLRYKVAEEEAPFFIIMGGKRRWIQDLNTWDTVFHDAEFHVDAYVADIAEGDPIKSRTFLARNEHSGEVCLVEDDIDVVHPVTTLEVLDRYGMGDGHLEHFSEYAYDALLKGKTRRVLTKDWADVQ